MIYRHKTYNVTWAVSRTDDPDCREQITYTECDVQRMLTDKVFQTQALEYVLRKLDERQAHAEATKGQVPAEIAEEQIDFTGAVIEQEAAKPYAWPPGTPVETVA